MKFMQQQKHTVDFLFILLLFGLFFLSALLLILIGASSYQSTVADMDENFETRTVTSYLHEKIRQNDTSDAISVSYRGNTCVLNLTQDYNGETYTTCLYQYDNYLREILVSSPDDFSLSGGQKVLPASDFRAALVSESLLEITVTDTNEQDYHIYITINCQGD